MSQSSAKTRKGFLLRFIIKSVIVLAAIAGVIFVAKLPSNNTDTEAGEAAPVNVAVMTIATETELADKFELPGVVEPNRVVAVSAEIAGKIEYIPVEKGQKIEENELLLQLNDDLIKPQVAIAEAQLVRDQIQLDRMSKLIENDATSQSDLDDATTRYKISQANLENINTQLERTSINAPITGILNELPVELGEYVQPGMPVAELVEIDTVKVVVDIPQKDISFLSVGEKAEVLVEYRGQEKTITGTITFLSELADSLTRSVPMEITIDNKEGYLHSGQIVTINLTRRIIKDAIMIPLLAVIPLEQGNAVYVVNSSEAQRRDVKLGLIKGDNIQITEGLEPGDKLIISGHRFVATGQKVNIVEEDTP